MPFTEKLKICFYMVLGLISKFIVIPVIQTHIFTFDIACSLYRLVVCNLYPFVKTVQKEDCTVADAVEEIDIGENSKFAKQILLLNILDVIEQACSVHFVGFLFALSMEQVKCKV